MMPCQLPNRSFVRLGSSGDIFDSAVVVITMYIAHALSHVTSPIDSSPIYFMDDFVNSLVVSEIIHSGAAIRKSTVIVDNNEASDRDLGIESRKCEIC